MRRVDAADALAKILTLRGHQMRVVSRGLDALAACDRMRPDVVALDIGLADVTGYQAAFELGQRDYRATTSLMCRRA